MRREEERGGERRREGDISIKGERIHWGRYYFKWA